ncbi:hypothetical protein CANTEDRAFT_111011 [Yamadazyma tenuis ATCC 10573]|uniref:STAS domain-containing protein n=1 Tax=Candida tenuis (strain ATCC 10573 / BCRC 21748 / CBS 615 / JCM 9827 / NBRC 10315 / NRRL Y-1498 / VKM Y-70) TaxID=590646 RepID=G3BE43_CANTC|nr:uncharacterized protein CANTEDRAFT_111011 [Yamadazyma tenuis ATCC 10573]EGV60453.1 hypothetical protein CANTEDRAFT_111011 [Yamadazyma tenuis ATCC 10573]
MSQDSRPGTSSTDGSENRLVSPSPSIRKISHQRVNPHENQTSFSKIPGGMGISGPSQHPSEYRPVTDEDSDSMSWGELLPYYLPILSWVNHYSLPFFLGDLLGGLSLVFFQLPLSISYATSLAHVPVICGLMSLGVAPLIYLIFGSVPQMITGPESAISLIVGQAVEPILHHNKTDINPVDLVVAMTFISGATLLGFGLGRFGFLDNVLSGSLLKGFISGVGIVMAINSLVSMLGLTKLMNLISNDPTDMDIHSPFDKFMFLIHHYDRYEPLTFKISFASFTFLMSVSIFKSYCSKRNFRFSDKLIYIPEILIMVIITSCLCYKFDWHANGIEVVGSVSQEGGTFSIYNPLSINQFRLMKKVGTSGFLCAMLGFFESTTASKSLGTTFNLPISSNRELVALGFINVVGSMFGALPAFGGYGRSKINAISAKTTFSGALMGIFTIFTIAFLSEGLYYIPKCILSVITAKIGLSLMDEAPYELMFHWRSRGYNELITFFVTVVTTIFFSMEAGIAVGLVYSLIRVIKNSTLSRIQILGRIPGTNTFVDADINDRLLKMDRKLGKSQLNLFTDDYFTSVNMNVLEEIEGCLIVKIPEPLTFTNTNDLRTRLKRVELYGSTKAHPAMKRSRDESMTKYVIFDLRGMSELDSSAAQILKELIINYQNRKIISLFVRVAKNLQVRERLFRTGIISLLIENLDALGYYKAKQEVLQKKPKDNSSDFLFEQETASGIANLVEAKDVPFFEHISDALKVIDYYESSNQVGEYSVV